VLGSSTVSFHTGEPLTHRLLDHVNFGPLDACEVMLVSNRGLICHQLLLLSPFIISALIAVAAVNTTPHEVTDLVWMELSSGPPHQRGLTTAGSGRAPPLHTARKRKLDKTPCIAQCRLLSSCCTPNSTPLTEPGLDPC
jgi:hypothetical protein